MIVVVILGVLIAIAFPQFVQSIRKGRRSDAITALAAIQQAQERSRSSFSTYCDEIASAATATRCGLGLGTSTTQYYSLAIDGAPTGTGYVAKATASGGQTNDTTCATMAVKMERGTLTYGSSSSSTVDWADPNRCWAK